MIAQAAFRDTQFTGSPLFGDDRTERTCRCRILHGEPVGSSGNLDIS
jgi:hypothetical protein